MLCLVCQMLAYGWPQIPAGRLLPSLCSTIFSPSILPSHASIKPAADEGAATDAAELVRVLPKTGIEAELSGGLKGWTCTAPKKLYVEGGSEVE